MEQFVSDIGNNVFCIVIASVANAFFAICNISLCETLIRWVIDIRLYEAHLPG